jgi:hypothetical protein
MSDPLARISVLKPKEPSTMMHPYMTEALADQRQREVRRLSAESRRGPVRAFPRWHLSWSRATLASGHRSSSLIIIISAHRPA